MHLPFSTTRGFGACWCMTLDGSGGKLRVPSRAGSQSLVSVTCLVPDSKYSIAHFSAHVAMTESFFRGVVSGPKKSADFK